MSKPKSGLAALAKPERKGNGGRCGVSVTLDALDNADATYLRSILAAPLSEWQHVQISTLLKEYGHKVSELTVLRHRRGKCSCA